MRLPLAISALVAATAPVFAQTANDGVSSQAGGGSSSVKQLLSQGYEIKSSLPNGGKFIVFMQKDKTAYACEFVTLTRSRCGVIN